MAKNNKVKKLEPVEVEEDFDMSEFACHEDHESMHDVMGGLVEASNNQMILAIELTKLAVDKCTKKNMNEDDVFAIFKKATVVISETSPLQDFLDQLSAQG